VARAQAPVEAWVPEPVLLPVRAEVKPEPALLPALLPVLLARDVEPCLAEWAVPVAARMGSSWSTI
jgi:hypothetical protein